MIKGFFVCFSFLFLFNDMKCSSCLYVWQVTLYRNVYHKCVNVWCSLDYCKVSSGLSVEACDDC